jgi:hypothetical protein
MRMASGLVIDLEDFKPKDVVLEDIMHALSHLCRWGGHCQRFYSVAQHSVLTARRVLDMTGAPLIALSALLHDASEAYLIDLPRPVKSISSINAAYIALETNVTRVIYKAFGVPPYWEFPVIKDVDDALCFLEGEQLFTPPYYPKGALHIQRPNWTWPIVPWHSVEMSRAAFLETFNTLSRSLQLTEPMDGTDG